MEAEFLTLNRQPHDRRPRKRFPPMAITDRRLKLLNFPKENVFDLRAAFFVETRGIVK
jgi:hypothetical protein